jgi:hypothetical protein
MGRSGMPIEFFSVIIAQKIGERKRQAEVIRYEGFIRTGSTG